MFAGIPIAFAFGIATLGYLGLSTHIPLSVLASRMDAGMSHPVLLSIPLFVFLGLLLEMTGMAEVIVVFLSSLLGHVRGGLSYVLIAAMYLVSGISGSKAADMAAIAPALFPEMAKRGIPRGDLVALLAATGAQTETIPPSLILITLGSVTGISIAGLFAGGVVLRPPGRRRGAVDLRLVPRRGAPMPGCRRARAGAVVRAACRWRCRRWRCPSSSARRSSRAVAMATGAFTIGIVYAGRRGCWYCRFAWRRLVPMLVDRDPARRDPADRRRRDRDGLGDHAIRFRACWRRRSPGCSGGAVVFLAVSILIFIVLGSVLEGIPAIVLMGPLLFPIAHQLGLNEVHYAMVAVLSMGIGLFAPPFGVGYYVACAIGECNPDDGLAHIGRYMLALVIGLLIVAAVPWLTTVVLQPTGKRERRT